MTRTRLGLVSFAFLLGTSAAVAAPCNPSATALCLSGGRFEVRVAWKDFGGNTGNGQALPLTADTGYFWFFSPSNVELVVKVLDARAFNHKFWVFFGALSNVEYTLTVTDSMTGAVKTYFNPSGQFASVGDTSAFDGSAGAVLAARGTSLERAAPKAAAFTPCPGPSTSLYLSGCRFRLDVHWTDAQGRNGAGQAVQLTGDTGYFWFFSDNNVELMVKVLDARAFNDKFWVFFGALSNVGYTIDVVDTVSGVRRTYENPLNRFASVGDTAAFRGGYAIAVQGDTTRSASGVVTADAGGSLSATAADGTVFTLRVPAGAVFEDQDITMTPVRATGAFPFAGGLAAGVDLQPAGLTILPGATLSIHTPTPISRSEETAVAWNGSGEDFFLFPPNASGGDLELYIQHLGGYGVARGTDAERALQLTREPMNDDDVLSHRISPLLREGRSAASPAAGTAPERTTDHISDLLKEAYGYDYDDLREEMLATDGEPGVVIALVLRTLAWKARVEHTLGAVDTVYPGRSEEIRSLFERILKKALVNIHRRCRSDADVILELPGIARLAQMVGANVLPEIDEAMQCLTFKLRFESKITDHRSGDRGSAVFVNTALAEITLETKRDADGLFFTSGEGTIDFTELSATGFDASCRVTHSSGPTPFRAGIAWKNFLRASVHASILLKYDPGFPPSHIYVACGNPNDEPSDFEDIWRSEFFSFHEENFSDYYIFSQGGFTLTGGQDPWAKVEVPNTDHRGITEKTTFTLTTRRGDGTCEERRGR